MNEINIAWEELSVVVTGQSYIQFDKVVSRVAWNTSYALLQSRLITVIIT